MTSVTRSQLAGGLLAVVLIAVIGTAIFLMGSPSVERTRRLDERRVEDLDVLARAVDLYWTRHGSLPSSVEQIQQEQGGRLMTSDPATNVPYEYRALDGQEFEVCAQFETESGESALTPGRDFWTHRVGRQCFRRAARKIG